MKVSYTKIQHILILIILFITSTIQIDEKKKSILWSVSFFILLFSTLQIGLLAGSLGHYILDQ